MGIGTFNPKDLTRTTSSKEAFVPGGENIRKYFSDALTTRPSAQDFNIIISQFYTAMDHFGIADVEGDETVLQQLLTAASASGEMTAVVILNKLKIDTSAGTSDARFRVSSDGGVTYVTSINCRNLDGIVTIGTGSGVLGTSASPTFNLNSIGVGFWRDMATGVLNINPAASNSGLRISTNGVAIGNNGTIAPQPGNALTIDHPGSSPTISTYGSLPTRVIARIAGTSAAAPTAIAPNIQALSIQVYGHTGTAYRRGMEISHRFVTPAPSETDMESQLELAITQSGAIAESMAMILRWSTGLTLFGGAVISGLRHFLLRQYANTALPSATNAGEMISGSEHPTTILRSNGASWVSPGVRQIALTINSNIIIPAGYAIDQIYFSNSTANVVTGGIKMGTIAAGTDIVASQAIGANELGFIPAPNILKRVFSLTASQSIFISAITAWNSANVNFSFIFKKVY